MLIENKILVGKNGDNEANLLLNMANRHGLITGASGSGKTITLKVLAEGFASANVPVFLVDVKGDLAGMVNYGNQETIQGRIDKLNIPDFKVRNFKSIFWDIYGEFGHPIRTTVSKMGPRLLSRILDLSDAQEGVLQIIFKIAEDEELEIVDLDDLKAMLNYVGEKRKEYILNYGNITTQSIGGILRNLLAIEDEGGNLFFGHPDFTAKNFIHFNSNTGESYINILDATKLFLKPNLYSTFMLWLLTSLYESLPEVGDLEKPKIVFFFDEAHLLFSEMPQSIIKNLTSIIKLIRSKGIGLYFISQTPSDIPEEVLAQLGNRIQHTLRAYTPNDEKIIKACANSFGKNPNLDIEETIKTLKTGEALISFQNENGEPTITDRFTILPPQSQMGTIELTRRKQIIEASDSYGMYENKIDDESAKELIEEIRLAEEEYEEEDEEDDEEDEKVEDVPKINNNDMGPALTSNTNYKTVEKEKESKTTTKKTTTKKTATTKKKSSSRSKKGYVSKKTDRLVNRTVSAVGTRLGNKIFKSLFK